MPCCGMFHIIRYSIIAVFFTCSSNLAFAEHHTGSHVIKALNASLLAMMQEADSLGFEGRHSYMTPVVIESFDMPLIARLATGKYWGKFSAKEQGQLVEALEELAITTYAARFKENSGVTFRILSEELTKEGALKVNSELIKGDGEAIILNYVMYGGASKWRIVDVHFLGKYSELSLRRSEYLSALSVGGIERLLSAINDKIEGYKTGTLQ